MKRRVVELQFVLPLVFMQGVFTSNAIPPTISSQPQSQTVILYERVFFEVTVSSAAPLTYQWNKDGLPVANATNNQIVIPQAHFADAGSYSVRVSNAEGSSSSTNALLTVNLPNAGDLDFSFASEGSTDADVWSLLLQPDGKVLIGGAFSNIKGVPHGKIARLDGDAAVDDTFMRDLTGPDRPVFASVFSIAAQSDGKLLIGGYFDTVNGLTRSNIARLNLDGTTDSTFQNGLSGADHAINSVAVESDGKILIGGSFATMNGVARNSIARLNANGTLDNAFQSALSGSGNAVYSMAVQSDGKVVIGGNFMTIGGMSRNNIARLNPDGSLDTGFQNGLSGANRLVDSVVVQTDGKVLVGGKFSTVNGVNRHNLARLNIDGTLDTGFQNPLSGVEGSVVIALQSDGKVLVGGGFTLVDNLTRNRIARLNIDGTLDAAFQSGLSGANAWVNCIGIQHDGRILIAGAFTTVNGVPVARFARLWGNQPSAFENIAPSIGGCMTLGLRLAAGTNRVQYKTNLTDTAWVDLAGDVTASASDCSTNKVDVTVGSARQRFYRLKQVP